MVYLMEGQLLPSERVQELLEEVIGCKISEGTLYNGLPYARQPTDLRPVFIRSPFAIVCTLRCSHSHTSSPPINRRDSSLA